MRVLFFGDSLTRGQVGASFVDLLAKDYPKSTFVKKGTNGDTLNIISQKLLAHLQKENEYDVLVLQGGANDLLLPFFKERGGLFEFAYNQQRKKGLFPLTTPQDFANALTQLFREIKKIYTGKLIFLTLGCLSEKLDTPLNAQRRTYNNVIRKVAAEEGIFLGDLETAFETVLNGRPQTDYLIENFWAVTITDRIISAFRRGPDYLSEKRKLHLTIDGGHINNTGAAILNRCLKNILEGRPNRKEQKAGTTALL